MELYVLDKEFEIIGIIDSASSVIWTERYYDAGDFEIYIQANTKYINLFKLDYYLLRMDSNMVGIIESINVTTDVENGDYIIVCGRDLKSIFDRRIIWNQVNFSGKTEIILRQLINENVISPSAEERKIPGVKLGSMKGFTEETELQITGGSLMNKIIELCKASEIGWKAFWDEEGKIVVDFFKGENRSYSQDVNPYVVFSPEFDNLLSTETIEDIKSYKNVALVAGEGEGISQITVVAGSAIGMERRELYLESNISSNNGEISDSDYLNLLKEAGYEQLAVTTKTLSVTGTAETTLMYKLNEDYFLGDIVAVTNEYGISANTKILEIIESEDETGYKVIPTFEEWRQV